MKLKQFLASEFWVMYSRVYLLDVDYISQYMEDEEVDTVMDGFISLQGVIDAINDAIYMYEKLYGNDLTATVDDLDAIYDAKQEDLQSIYPIDFVEFEFQ